MIHNLIDRPRWVGVFHSLFLYTEYFISFNVLSLQVRVSIFVSKFVVIRLWRMAVNRIIRVHLLPKGSILSTSKRMARVKSVKFSDEYKRSWFLETRILEDLNLSFWRNLILSFFLSFSTIGIADKVLEMCKEQRYNRDHIAYYSFQRLRNE